MAIIAGGLVILLPLTVAEVWWLPTPTLSLKAWGLSAVAALLPGALSYLSYAYVQRALGVARTGLMMCIEQRVFCPADAAHECGSSTRCWSASGG